MILPLLTLSEHSITAIGYILKFAWFNLPIIVIAWKLKEVANEENG